MDSENGRGKPRLRAVRPDERQRGGIPVDAPVIDPMACPGYVSDAARVVWGELFTPMPAHLRPGDLPLMQTLSELHVELRAAQQELGQDPVVDGAKGRRKSPAAQVVRDLTSRITSLSVKLQLTPSARAHAARSAPAGQQVSAGYEPCGILGGCGCWTPADCLLGAFRPYGIRAGQPASASNPLFEQAVPWAAAAENRRKK